MPAARALTFALLILVYVASAEAAATTSLRHRLGQRIAWMTNPCFKSPSNHNGALICVPSIWIGGIYKSGTSAIFHFLSLHSAIRGSPLKEVCPRTNEDPVDFLYRLTQLSQPIRTNQLLIWGCMGSDHPLMQQIALEFDTKLIFIYRRWPGWVYAAYNYWCNDVFDANCDPKGSHWIDDKRHYRTPELFHELVLAGDKIATNPIVPSLKFNYRVFVEGMERTYKKELMFVIDAEDLAANGETVMKRAFRFVGVQHAERLPPMLYNHTVNAASHKGVKALSPKEAVLGATYRPMLPATEALLEERWNDTCHWMVQHLGLSWTCGATPTPHPLNAWGMQISALAVAVLMALRFGGRCRQRRASAQRSVGAHSSERG